MEIAKVVELADVFFALAGYGRVGYGEELVGCLAHRGDYYDRFAIGAGFYDIRDSFDGLGGFYRGSAEFHYDHESEKNGQAEAPVPH
jgi:hypothetical protein